MLESELNILHEETVCIVVVLGGLFKSGKGNEPGTILELTYKYSALLLLIPEKISLLCKVLVWIA